MGKPLRSIQQIGGINYQTSATYNLAAAIATMTYPSGRTITNTFNTAGRLSSFAGNLGDGTQRNYSTGIGYSPFGGITWEQYGTNTPLYNKTFYNVRGQMWNRSVSSVNDTWDWNRGRFILYYESNHLWGQSGATNNGNVIYEDTWIPSANGSAQILFQDDYHYDSLNRLSSTNESSLDFATSTWTARFAQVFSYDRYGNRTIDQVNTLGAPKPNFGVNLNTNQLTAPAGYSMTYDEAGNLINDTYSGQGTRTYDAENRMKQAWANNQWETYSYDGDGHRIKRLVNGTEIWQVHGLGGELIAEYAANSSPSTPQKEYGYRNGELLVTADAPSTQNVAWTNAVGVSVSGNSLTKTAADGWGNAGAASTQTITSGDGYVEFTASETSTYRMCGLSHVDADQNYASIDFAMYPTGTGSGSHIYIYESGIYKGDFGAYATGDLLRVAVEGGAVKYKKNGVVFYTSTATPSYPLLVDTSLYSNGSTISNVVISSANGGGGAQIHWLVTDQLGTPRMVFDQSGSLANVSRHDYLPFGEELFAGTGGRTTAQGYSASDGVRQHFTGYEADAETGLNFAQARYQSPLQGRFTSVDPLGKSASVFNPQTFNRYSYVLNNPLNLIDPTGRQSQPKHKPAKKDGDEMGGNGCVGDCGTPTGVIAEVTVTAPPEPITFEFEYPLTFPRTVPAPTAPAAGGAGWTVLGKLLGAAGIILTSATPTGGGDTCPGGCCTCQTTTSVEPNTSVNPNPEDNKPDIGDSTKNDDDNGIVFRVYSPGQPAFQLRPGEQGISVFNPTLVQPPLTPGEVLQGFRPGSSVTSRTTSQIRALGLQLIRTPGADVLSVRLRAAHLEIRPGPGMSRNAFKTALKGLN